MNKNKPIKKESSKNIISNYSKTGSFNSHSEFYSQNQKRIECIKKVSNVNVTSISTIERFTKEDIKISKQKKNVDFIKNELVLLKVIKLILSYYNSSKIKGEYVKKIKNKEIERYLLYLFELNNNSDEDNIYEYNQVSLSNTDSLTNTTSNNYLLISSIVHPFLYKNINLIIISTFHGDIFIYNLYREIFKFNNQNNYKEGKDNQKNTLHLKYLFSIEKYHEYLSMNRNNNKIIQNKNDNSIFNRNDLFLSYGDSNHVLIWRLFSENPLKSISFHERISSCSILNDNRIGFIFQNTGEIIVIDLFNYLNNNKNQNYKQSFHFPPDTDWGIEIITLHESLVNTYLLVVSYYNNIIRLIDYSKEEVFKELSINSIGRVLHEIDNSYFISLHDNGNTYIWEYMSMNTLFKIIELTHEGYCYSATLLYSLNIHMIYITSLKGKNITILSHNQKEFFIKKRMENKKGIMKMIYLTNVKHFSFVSIGFNQKKYVLYGLE